ncbi:MAG: DUF6044 family protein [Bacteroidota bacterium]|nr:DUF6044 family protein [Bacteroidota bacterium]
MDKTNFIEKLNKIESAIAISIFVCFIFYFIPSPNHEIRVHDIFDGNFTTRHVLIKSGHLFDTSPTATVPGIMNGLPRGVFPRNTEITSVLMFMFGSLTGYAITFVLIRLLAFIGIVLFARDHIHSSSQKTGIVFIVASVFACLPYFAIHGLTVAGIPLLLWAFLNVYKKKKLMISYMIMVLFVLWSNFVLVGFHLLLLLGGMTLWFCITNKKIYYHLFIYLFALLTCYIASDYMLFYMHYFNKDYVTSREAMDKLLGLNINGVLGSTLKSFFFGDYSTANYFGFAYIPLFLLFSYYLVKRKVSIQSNIILVLIICYVIFSLLINILDWKSIAGFYENFAFAKVFNFKRFTSLLPGLFFCISVAIFLYLLKLEKTSIRVAISLSTIVLFLFIWRGNLSLNRSAFNTTGFKIYNEQQTTFNEFFDEALYSKLKLELGENYTGNVIHYGLFPSPSKYAGLNVLDDYQGDYPKKYKIEFRKVIEGELNKSQSLTNYFDKWGSRCYLESARSFENKLEVKDGILFDNELNINTNQLKLMNCHYIFSSIIITNVDQLQIKLKRIFVSRLNHKVIFLYHIN